MYILLCIVIVIACLLLIGAVLIQKSKGGGLASDYSSGNQYMGYRKTTDFIEKATWTLAIVICLASILGAFAVKAPLTSDVRRHRHLRPQQSSRLHPPSKHGRETTTITAHCSPHPGRRCVLSYQTQQPIIRSL